MALLTFPVAVYFFSTEGQTSSSPLRSHWTTKSEEFLSCDTLEYEKRETTLSNTDHIAKSTGKMSRLEEGRMDLSLNPQECLINKLSLFSSLDAQAFNYNT